MAEYPYPAMECFQGATNSHNTSHESPAWCIVKFFNIHMVALGHLRSAVHLISPLVFRARLHVDVLVAKTSFDILEWQNKSTLREFPIVYGK